MGYINRNKTELDILIGIGGIDMSRKILKASDGMILTNGEIYGSEIYLAEGVDASTFYEIPESEIANLEEATPEDYMEAMARMGGDVRG